MASYIFGTEIAHGLPTPPPDPYVPPAAPIVQGQDQMDDELSDDSFTLGSDTTMADILDHYLADQVDDHIMDLLRRARDDRNLEAAVWNILNYCKIETYDVLFGVYRYQSYPEMTIVTKQPDIYSVWRLAGEMIKHELRARCFGEEEFIVTFTYEEHDKENMPFPPAQEREDIPALWDRLVNVIDHQTNGRDDLGVERFGLGGDEYTGTYIAVFDRNSDNVLALRQENNRIFGGELSFD